MNAKIIAIDETIHQIVKSEIIKLGPKANLNHIDVSQVTNMQKLFSSHYNDVEFDGDVSQWNVSGVLDMSELFSHSDFNGDLSKWDTSNVQDMSYIFCYSKFNGDISKWKTKNVLYLTDSFYGSVFNDDISSWDVSNVQGMSGTFEGSEFCGDISKWNVSNVTDMEQIFQDSKFCGDISNWQLNPSIHINSDIRKILDVWQEIHRKKEVDALRKCIIYQETPTKILSL